MGHNNRRASAPGGAAGSLRLQQAKASQRAAPNTSAAVRLVLKEHHQLLQASASSVAGPLGHAQFSSSTSTVRVSGLARRTLILGEQPNKPLTPARLAKIYRRHRNPERALVMFFWRRQQWKKSRRPSITLAFLEHFRRFHFRKPSSNEEPGLVFRPAAAQNGPSQPAMAANTTPSEPVTAAKATLSEPVTSAKTTPSEPVTTAKSSMEGPQRPAEGGRRRKASAAADETSTESLPPKKKAKVLTTLSAASSNAVRKVDGSEKTEHEGDQRAVKKAADHSVSKPIPPTAESSKASRDLPVRSKPVAKMEFFEQRVHEMVTNPLEFDDFVYDSNRPPSRQTARMFARCRGRQTQPPPPLVMSGAIGSPGGSKVSSPASSRKEPRSPAKEARQQPKGPGAGRGRKGKGVASLYSDDESMRSVGSKSSLVRDAGVGKAKGKGKERAWLTNGRSKQGVKGGQQHPHRAYKSTR